MDLEKNNLVLQTWTNRPHISQAVAFGWRTLNTVFQVDVGDCAAKSKHWTANVQSAQEREEQRQIRPGKTNEEEENEPKCVKVELGKVLDESCRNDFNFSHLNSSFLWQTLFNLLFNCFYSWIVLMSDSRQSPAQRNERPCLKIVLSQRCHLQTMIDHRHRLTFGAIIFNLFHVTLAWWSENQEEEQINVRKYSCICKSDQWCRWRLDEL